MYSRETSAILLGFIGERVLEGCIVRTSRGVGFVAHAELYLASLHDVVMREVVLGIRLAAQLDALDVLVDRTVVSSLYGESLAILKMQGHLVEVWRTYDVLVGTRTYGIESEC